MITFKSMLAWIAAILVAALMVPVESVMAGLVKRCMGNLNGSLSTCDNPMGHSINPPRASAAPGSHEAPSPPAGSWKVVNLSFSAGKLRFAPAVTGKGRIVTMAGFATASVPGEPSLPFCMDEVVLPEEAIPATVRLEVTEGQPRTLPGRHRIAVVPPPPGPNGPLPDQSRGDSFRVSVSRDNHWYPSEAVSLASVTARQGNRGSLEYVARVVYHPVQYNPATGELRLLSRAQVQIHYAVSETRLAGQEGARASYVIITTNAIRDGSDELANFVRHKTWLGHSVRIVTEDDYEPLTGPYPNGRAEKIRQWLIKNWRQLGIEYVLLVGNPEPDDPMYSDDVTGDVPMKQVWHALPGKTNPSETVVWWGDATDAYYADLTGNWDSDGDGFYGESPWLKPEQIIRSPLPQGISLKGFSMRCFGSFSLASPQTVTFNLGQWPMARLYVDSVLVMNHWPVTPRKSDTQKKVSLGAGLHTVKVEYAQHTGHGHLVLKLNGTDMTGFKVFYYASLDLSGKEVATSDDQTMRYNWETSDHASLSPNGIGVDLDAEVSVGRIPVFDDNYAGLDAILRRTIDYESAPPAPWRSKALLAMVPLTDTTPAYDIGEALKRGLPPDLSIFRLYDDDYGLTDPPDLTPISPANFISAWNQGFGLVTWVTHGHWRYAAGLVDVKYHLSSLSDQYPPITFQASCGTGSVYLPDCYPLCAADINDPTPDEPGHSDGRLGLAYSLLRSNAVATVAATEVASLRQGAFTPDPFLTYNQHLAYAYTMRVGASGDSLGEAFGNTRYTPFGITGVDYYEIYHNLLIFNLYGDPSLKLLANPPANRYASFEPIENQEVFAGRPLKFKVSATDPEGDMLTYAAQNMPPGAVFNPATRIFSWTTNLSQVGKWYPTFTVADSGNPALPDTKTVVIEVLEPEFYCDFSHGGPTGDPDWVEVKGDWSVKDGKYFQSAPGTKSLALVDGALLPPAPSGTISALVRLDGTEGNNRSASLVFGYQQTSGPSWRHVTLKPTRVVIGTNTGTAVSKHATVKTGVWHQLQVRAAPDGGVHVTLDNTKTFYYKFPAAVDGLFGVSAAPTGGSFDNFVMTSD